MGKRLRQQRRGKGSNAYTKPPNRYKADVVFRNALKDGRAVAEVIDLIDDPGHGAPLMKLKYEDKTEIMLIAPEGIKVGDKLEEGPQATLLLGSVMRLSSIPDGMMVYNIERTPGDGGKLVRAAGSYATIVSHNVGTVTVQMPSKSPVILPEECRAEIGVISAGGMEMQPILKAGKSHYMHHATNKYWPRNRGVKMNPVDHPFGGKQHHKGSSSMISRNAPPGAKVGHIAASRVGRKKRG